MFAGLSILGASLTLVMVSGPPTLPNAPEGSVPPPAEPTAEPTVEPTTEPTPSASGEPAVAATTDDPFAATEPEPAPISEPVEQPAPAASGGSESDPPDTSPVVRAREGNWGLQFTFGGLAPLSIAGVRDHGVNRLLFSELGARRMLGNGWSIPFSVGAGVFHHNPDMGGKQNDVGLAGSVGVRKNFRVWRRITPYVGGDLRLHYLDPTGDNNWLVGIGFGPVLGIEYFIGDRVSLLLQGEALIGVAVFDGLVQVRAATQVAAGGQLGLLFYF